MDMIERSMPCSVEAEQAVLGSILIDPSCMDELTGMLTENDFYMHEHAEIYSAMQSMYATSKNIDVVTLLDTLVVSGTYDEAGGRSYLALVADVVPTAINALDYAKIVRDKALLRKLIEVGESIAESAYMGEDSAEALIESAESQVYQIADSRSTSGFTGVQEAMVSAMQTLSKLSQDPDALRGVPTGFPALDDVIVGMSGADLVLIGARPGMGKTAFAMNIALSAAEKTQKTVCVFSLEMSAEQLINRVIASEAQIDSYKLRTGDLQPDDWQKIAYTASHVSEMDIRIDDTPGATVSGIRSKLRRVKNLGLVVIDYLQLMQGEKRTENRVQEVGEISRGLKLLAKEFDVPVVCCAQLNRGTEGRSDKRPMLSDLRDSGAIEQDADVIMFLYRDEYYNADTAGQSVADVIVAKNRHGSLGNIKLGWLGRYTKFISLAQA